MKKLIVFVGLLTILALVALALVSCESADEAAARRATAESGLVRAQADAYAQRSAADEARRENGHQRALETLPYLVIILGGLALAALGALILWDLMKHQRQSSAEPTAWMTLQTLERLSLAQAERDRQMWRAIAALDRRLLQPAVGREVTIHHKDSR